jgi:phage gpG-like protein
VIRIVGTVSGHRELDRAFNRVDKFISDFRNVWPAITDIFYAAEEKLFDSQGATGASGKWAPLSRAYKKFKDVAYPGQPILRRDDTLYESLTSPDGLDSIYRAEPLMLTIGTKAPHARAHQHGLKVPKRSPISLTQGDKRKMQKAVQVELVKFTRDLGFQVQEKAA